MNTGMMKLTGHFQQSFLWNNLLQGSLLIQRLTTIFKQNYIFIKRDGNEYKAGENGDLRNANYGFFIATATEHLLLVSPCPPF